MYIYIFEGIKVFLLTPSSSNWLLLPWMGTGPEEGLL